MLKFIKRFFARHKADLYFVSARLSDLLDRVEILEYQVKLLRENREKLH